MAAYYFVRYSVGCIGCIRSSRAISTFAARKMNREKSLAKIEEKLREAEKCLRTICLAKAAVGTVNHLCNVQL